MQPSYSEAVTSVALIGGSSIIEMAVKIVRTKTVAMLVGPGGIGLLGVYGIIASLVGNLVGMGIKTSGVRQIAEAVGTGDAIRIARTVRAVRGVAFISGLAGALLLVVASRLISRMTFGNEGHAAMVMLLALTVLLTELSEAQAAILQGTRRIADLARVTVLSVIYGTLFGLPFVYFLHDAGLVPSLICVSAASAGMCWWYARKVAREPVSMTFQEMAAESSQLLKHGVVFMSSGLMVMGSAYLVRLAILRKLGIESAGFFQAAWVIAGLYTGLVGRAMEADFYPRLVSVAHRNKDCNRLANEQAQMVLLLACPGVLATLTFAPIVIEFFYSSKFGPAASILRWICLGMLLQVVAWSMGFIVLAKGRRLIFFMSELLSNVTLVGLVFVGVQFVGLDGAGMAWGAMYLLYVSATYFVARGISGFRLSRANQRLVSVFLPLIVAVLAAPYFVPGGAAAIFGIFATVCATLYALKNLYQLLPRDRFPVFATKLLQLLRLAPAEPFLPTRAAPGISGDPSA